MSLVLASASPRRRELLTQAGYTFTMSPSAHPRGPAPQRRPHRLRCPPRPSKSRSRLRTVTTNSGSTPIPQVPHRRSSSAPTPPSPSTTISSANPRTRRRRPHVRLLSGRTHRVITGVAVVTAARTEVAAEVTGVRFLTLSEEEIAAYIATGEPMDKAGAYAIQGRAARWIPRITGDYFNVVGLPLALVSTMLEAASAR